MNDKQREALLFTINELSKVTHSNDINSPTILSDIGDKITKKDKYDEDEQWDIYFGISTVINNIREL